MVNYSARFKTKDESISIPDNVYSLQDNLGPRELINLVKTVLKESLSEDQQQSIESKKLSFVINGRLLRTSLDSHFKDLEEPVNIEKVLEIEYYISQKSPKPINSCSTDDWISCIHVNDRAIISGCYDGMLNIWSNGKCDHLITIPAHGSAVKDVKWLRSEQMTGLKNVSKSDLYFISCSNDETAIVWRFDPSKQKVDQVYLCKGHTRSVDCVDIHDDIFATGSYDRLLKIWTLYDKEDEEPIDESDAKKVKYNDDKDGILTTNIECKAKAPLMTLSDHTEAITGLNFIKDELINDGNSANNPTTIATCSMDNTIKLWDIELGKVSQTLSGSKAFLAINYSPLNRCLITGSCDRHIRLWDPRSSEGSLVKSVFTSHQGWITSVAWSTTNDNLFVSGAYDSLVKQWDIRCTRGPLYDLIGHEDKVLAVDWSNPKYIVSGSADKHLKVYENE